MLGRGGEEEFCTYFATWYVQVDLSAESIIEEPVKDSKTQTKKGRPKGRASSMSLLQSPRKADPRRRRSRREELIL